MFHFILMPIVCLKLTKSRPQAEVQSARLWEMVYNHYTVCKGLDAPYCKMFAEKVRPEGGGGDYGLNSGGYDQLGYGTLTFSLDPTETNAGSPRSN
jgi:hypothetical protein